MKYSVLTFGCRVNQADSLGFEEDLLARGAVASDVADADLVIVNTCSVTASADQAARQAIRRVSRLNPDAEIVVTGCYATRRPEEVRALPNVMQVLHNDDKPRLIPLTLAGRDPLVDRSGLTTASRFAEGDGSCGAHLEPGVAGRTAFTLRVQTGCAEPCAYCIIPTTRGTPRSRPLGEVVAEARRVAASGFKEVAITGVHLGSYGRDLTPALSLVELLRALSDDSSRERSGPPLGCHPDLFFRISSLEPMDCTPEIVELVAGSAVFAPHFHLPLQHASPRMLRAMRRPYTFDYFRLLADSIRTRIPHASIGSDLIVGFPGETDDDFAQSVAYLEQSPLTHLHVFPYSDRPGTAAAAMENKVSGLVVRERASRLRQISERLSTRFRKGQVGSVQRALTIDDGATAVTGNYLKVKIGEGQARNEWIAVRIASDDGGLRGVVLPEA